MKEIITNARNVLNSEPFACSLERKLFQDTK